MTGRDVLAHQFLEAWLVVLSAIIAGAEVTSRASSSAFTAALIAPGDTWNFQLVFRDPIGGPLTFNTSDALSASFCP